MNKSGEKPKIAFVFPGQGSQAVGMGLDLYRNSPAAREVFEQADHALDFPLARLCFEGPEKELRQTINAQPAIMTVSAACLKAASELDGWFEPSFVAGHSLGEYTALVAAQVLDFTNAIKLVRERGRLMEEAGTIQPGGMAAIIGLDESSLKQLCLRAEVNIANINSPNQIVVSGKVAALAQVMKLARTQGAKAIPLEVSGAFHSQLMEPATQGLAKFISQIELHNPKVPIVVNTSAQPVTTAEEIKTELLQQLPHCIHWLPSVEYMLREGVSTFIEIGPGKVLSGLIKRIERKAQVFNIYDMSSIQALSLSY